MSLEIIVETSYPTHSIIAPKINNKQASSQVSRAVRQASPLGVVVVTVWNMFISISNKATSRAILPNIRSWGIKKDIQDRRTRSPEIIFLFLI